MISGETPTIAHSNQGHIYIIGGGTLTLTCMTEPKDIGGAIYQWKLKTKILYVSL